MKIVDHYLALADKSAAAKDMASTTRWIERAKLLGANSEVIREKERSLGLVKAEK